MLALEASAAVSIRTDESYPIRGETINVTTEDETGPLEGAIVQVEYRPNSSTPRTETLEPTDESGMTSWTPSGAGLARLSVVGPDGPTGTIAVSVRYTSFEPGGIAIMLFAGLFLFGGAAYGMFLLLNEKKVPAEEPPST
jgi:hypothetical protein